MDFGAILQQLRIERDGLITCIRTLEELQRLRSGQPRRGRPPKWMKRSKSPAVARKARKAN
jgi:hypothetical protein